MRRQTQVKTYVSEVWEVGPQHMNNDWKQVIGSDKILTVGPPVETQRSWSQEGQIPSRCRSQDRRRMCWNTHPWPTEETHTCNRTWNTNWMKYCDLFKLWILVMMIEAVSSDEQLLVGWITQQNNCTFGWYSSITEFPEKHIDGFWVQSLCGLTPISRVANAL